MTIFVAIYVFWTCKLRVPINTLPAYSFSWDLQCNCGECFQFRWVPSLNRTGGSSMTSTPPLPSNGSTNDSPHVRRNTLPRYSPRDMSSSGNNSQVASPVETADEDRNRRLSWQEIQNENFRRGSPRRVSVLRVDPQTGRTETLLIENVTNGDSGRYNYFTPRVHECINDISASDGIYKPCQQWNCFLNSWLGGLLVYKPV